MIEHLEWKGTGGPLISFFTNWNAALRRRQRMIDDAAKEVVIIAVWLKHLASVYDAAALAQALHLRNQHLYQHEVLLQGGIRSDSRRILAMFRGIQRTESVTLGILTLTLARKVLVFADMPGNFVAGVQASTRYNQCTWPDVSDRLQGEVYTRTEEMDMQQYDRLALIIGDVGYTETENGETCISLPSNAILDEHCGIDRTEHWIICSSTTP